MINSISIAESPKTTVFVKSRRTGAKSKESEVEIDLTCVSEMGGI